MDNPRIEHRTVVELSPTQLARCRELSLGEDGYMCELLDKILSTETKKEPYRYSHAILLGDTAGPPSNMIWDRLEIGEIYGWALLTPVPRSPRYYLHLFVDPLHRGKGYGSLLLRLANVGKNSRAYQPLVMTDPENQGFFEKHAGLFKEF